MYEVRVFPEKGEVMIAECARVSSPWEAVDVAQLIHKLTARVIEVVDLSDGEVVCAFRD